MSKKLKNLLKISSFFFVLLIYSLSETVAQNIVDANNRFSFDMYDRSRQAKNTDNIFFSPYSIVTAFAMTYEGARSETAKEMEKVFCFTTDNKLRREQFSELISEINKKDKKYKLHTANALWVEKTYKLLDEYLKIIEKYYHGKTTNAGFIDAGERELSRQMINGWVETNTNNKIKEILKPFHLTQDTRLVLTNAIYFKGNWEMQFNKKATKEEDFKVSPDKKIKVPMMSLGRKGMEFPELRYAETEDLQILELP